MDLQINQQMTPISCVVSTSRSDFNPRITPNLPAGLTYSYEKLGSQHTVTISGTPVEGFNPRYFYVGYNAWVSAIRLSVATVPTSCSYGFDRMTLYTDIIMEPIPIRCDSAISSFSINPQLPEGMSMDTTTGTISGTLKNGDDQDIVYTVTATNTYGSTTTTFSFQARDQSEMTTPGMIGCYWNQITECRTPEFDFFYKTPAQHCQTVGEVRFTDNNVDNTWPGLDRRFLDYYSAYFYSYIIITRPGTYEFALSSDDGAILYIDDLENALITRDGCRALSETLGSKTLTRGRHLLVIRYLEYNQWASMYVKMGSQELDIERNYIQSNQLRVGGRGPTFIDYDFVGGYVDMDMALFRPTLASGAPVSWTVTPDLPDGISLDNLLGYISGRPSAPSSGVYTVTATGVNGAATATVRIVVTATPMNGVHEKYYKVTDISSQICNYAKLTGNAIQISQIHIGSTPIDFYSSQDTVWEGFPSDFTSFFYMEYEGYLKMETIGNWRFRIHCDDGCKLFGADEQLLINMWGCSDVTGESIFPVSKSGYYYFRIEYFQKDWNKRLKFEWKAPNSFWEVVPPANMYYVPTGVLTYNRERTHYYKNTPIEENIPILFSVTSLTGYTAFPNLPAGFILNQQSGRITGTPTETMIATSYTITANAGSQKETAVITFDVLDLSPPSNLAYTYNSATVSAQSPITLIPLRPISQFTISNPGNSVVNRYTVTPDLPAGLSLDAATGAITGTPTEAKANAVYTIMAINPAGSFPILVSLGVSGCKGTGWTGDFIHVRFLSGSGTVSVVNAQDAVQQCSVNTMGEDGNAVSVQCMASVSSTSGEMGHFCINPSAAGSYRLKALCMDSAGCRWQVSRDGNIYYPYRLAYEETGYQYTDYMNYPISATTLTSLTINPTSITAFSGIAIENIEVTPNGCYKSISISPALGDVSIDPTYPVLTGTAIGNYGTTVYTITATGNHGTAQATLTVNFDLCSAASGRMFVTFKKVTKSYGQEESWELKKDGVTVTSQGPFVANQEYQNAFCLETGDYVLIMKDSFGDGWSANANLYAYDSNDDLIETFYFANPGNTAIKTKEIQWKLEASTTSVEWKALLNKKPDSKWKEATFDASSWTTVKNGIIGQWSQNGIYFIYQFDLTEENYQLYPIIEFGIYYKDGAIVYLNGNEVYRRNIASSSTNQNTQASSTFDGFLTRVGTAAGHLLVAGRNSLAVEIHRYPGVSGNIEWNAYVSFKEGDCILRSTGGSITESQFYDKAGETAHEAWDTDASTQWTENGLPAWSVYSYNFDRVEWINRVTIGGCIDANEWQGRNPAMFTIYGSNDGLNWETLYSYEKKNMFTKVGEEKSFMLMNHMNSYGRYKFEINKSANGVSQTSVSKIALEACRLVYCPKDGDYPGTLAGEMVTIDCAEGYIGERYRACGTEAIKPVWGTADEKECRSKYPNSKDISYIDAIMVIAPYLYADFIQNSADFAVQSVISNVVGIPTNTIEVWKVKDVSDTFQDEAMADQNKVAVYVRITVDNEQAATVLNKFTASASDIAQNFIDYYSTQFSPETRVAFLLIPELNQYQGLGKVNGWIIFFLIVVILILVALIGFYAWTRLKNKKTKNGAKKLRASAGKGKEKKTTSNNKKERV